MFDWWCVKKNFKYKLQQIFKKNLFGKCNSVKGRLRARPTSALGKRPIKTHFL